MELSAYTQACELAFDTIDVLQKEIGEVDRELRVMYFSAVPMLGLHVSIGHPMTMETGSILMRGKFYLLGDPENPECDTLKEAVKLWLDKEKTW
jgi:hypothetical protein